MEINASAIDWIRFEADVKVAVQISVRMTTLLYSMWFFDDNTHMPEHHSTNNCVNDEKKQRGEQQKKHTASIL